MSENSINHKNKEEIEHIVKYIDNNGNITKIVNHNLKTQNNIFKINDFCKQTHTNKFIYIGEWKSDMREGNGVYYNHYTQEKYKGEFKNGKAEGKGTFYYNNGDIYKGGFKNWLKEGKGIYNFNCGDRFEGTFKNDLPDKGIYFFKNGNKLEF